LAARKAESAGGTVAAFDKLGLGKPFSLTEGVVWQAAAAALFLHALAHILVAFMERED
jgi:hypothetical protein